MNEISCDVCMDLIPLVRDGIASEDSRTAVENHIASCPACRSLYDGQQPPPADGSQVLLRCRRQIRLFAAMVLMFGILSGLGLTASAGLFYNTLIMPLTGALGYLIFRWRALYTVPALLLATHLLTTLLHLPPGAEHLSLPEVLIWTGLYSLFTAAGTLTAGLLHFAFRKEKDHG